MDNNTAHRAVKPVAIGRKNGTFSGQEGGGKPIAYTFIETAKFKMIGPKAGLTWGLAHRSGPKFTRLDDLFPWRYAAWVA